MKRFKYYLNLWWMMSRNSFLPVIYAKTILVIFFTGKSLRFIFFALFLYFIVKETGSLADYSLTQSIFFFVSFNAVDVISQFLFREVYRFRSLIISGDFDLVLAKPWNPLFRSLLGGADFIDLVTIPPLFAVLIYFGIQLGPTAGNVLLYLLLMINGIFISASFYILILSFGILTLEVDNMVMIYRDMSALGKLPTDIYREPIRGIITYLIPIGIMMTFPAKAIMGIISPQSVLVSFTAGVAIYIISTKFWRFALSKYTSASS